MLRQLQQKYLIENKNLKLTFVDFGNVFDQVPRGFLQRALGKIDVQE